MLTIGPDIVTTPRHRDFFLSLSSDTDRTVVLSVNKPGVTFAENPVSLSAGVQKTVQCYIKNTNRTYTITASGVGDASSDTCTIEVQSSFTSYDMDEIRDTIADAMKSIECSYKPRVSFTPVASPTYSEMGQDQFERQFYTQLTSVSQGGSQDTNIYSFDIYVVYDEALKDSDIVEIRSGLNNYDWPVGIISAWCNDVIRSETAEEQPYALATLDLEIYS